MLFANENFSDAASDIRCHYAFAVW